MARIETRTEEITGLSADTIPYGDLMRTGKPALLKGVLSETPLAQAGKDSASAAVDYLMQFYSGKPVVGARQPAAEGGRFFYDETVTRLNFTARREDLGAFLGDALETLGQPDADHLYIGSTDLDTYLPGIRNDNGLVLNHEMFEKNRLTVSIWLGNRTTATCHYDMSNNLACCMVGKRRFTLFPPDQIANLYPGPLEPTPGGQVVSMVDFREPDYDRFPDFRKAEAVGQVAEMEPGDVLFYPSMWWHHVEALSDFNAMVNYWWNTSPAYMDTPQNTLLHGLLSLRDRPQGEKEAWRALFDYYVFGPAERAGQHLPDTARGPLGQLDEMQARRLRANLLDRMNR